MPTNNNSFGSLVVRHAAAMGAIAAIMIGLIGLPALAFGEVWRAKWGGWAAVNGAYISLALYLVWIILTRPAPDFLGLPKVIAYRRDLGALIVKDAPWLSMNVAASIYVIEDDVERLICLGKVQNVQTNKLVQVGLFVDTQTYSEEDIRALETHIERTKLSHILVKPGLYQEI